VHAPAGNGGMTQLTPAPGTGILGPMDVISRAHAEARLEEAAAALRLADPRPALRERLRLLREAQPDAFRRAIDHYETTVLPALAGDDPLAAWLEYGRFIGQLTSNGRLTAIDSTGRAAPHRPPAAAGIVVLYLPEDTAVDALLLASPREPSAAQQAAIQLLVHRKLSL
jgi:hypothetical protein